MDKKGRSKKIKKESSMCFTYTNGEHHWINGVLKKKNMGRGILSLIGEPKWSQHCKFDPCGHGADKPARLHWNQKFWGGNQKANKVQLIVRGKDWIKYKNPGIQTGNHLLGGGHLTESRKVASNETKLGTERRL